MRPRSQNGRQFLCVHDAIYATAKKNYALDVPRSIKSERHVDVVARFALRTRIRKHALRQTAGLVDFRYGVPSPPAVSGVVPAASGDKI